MHIAADSTLDNLLLIDTLKVVEGVPRAGGQSPWGSGAMVVRASGSSSLATGAGPSASQIAARPQAAPASRPHSPALLLYILAEAQIKVG